MKIPKEWENVLEENQEIKEMFLEQENMDIYDDEPVPPFFFHYFRPNKYDKLKGFFVPFLHGEEMFKRLKLIYDVTADEYEKEDGTIAGYFVPKKNIMLSRSELENIALKHAEGINEILTDLEERSLIDCDNLEIRIMDKREFEDKYDYYDILNCDLYDMQGDWFRDLEEEASENPLILFSESLYNIACDYDLARYVMWPLIERNDMKDPYEAYFNLWKYGYRPMFVNDKLLILC
ncbi:hypothetical protein [Clostridium sp. JS66]|uniref:hypothetical protein n=1 Tax=Clostridium sp. JS66 TaxID=3064705 RepID=UPI00298EACB7|nr:hypothetical protein [Clostridium sp. JS66]WPC40109.1 hypothetical protein Q6H37_19670 [Clostridium sp. JS66]